MPWRNNANSTSLYKLSLGAAADNQGQSHVAEEIDAGQ